MVIRLFVLILFADVIGRSDAEWCIDVQGLLGILNILGIEHLMVITGKEEICKLKHEHQHPL
jgi:hypothetical protein